MNFFLFFFFVCFLRLSACIHRTSNLNGSSKKKKRSKPFLDHAGNRGGDDEEVERMDKVIKRLRLSSNSSLFGGAMAQEEGEDELQDINRTYIERSYEPPSLHALFPSSDELEESNVDYSKVNQVLNSLYRERELRKRTSPSSASSCSYEYEEGRKEGQYGFDEEYEEDEEDEKERPKDRRMCASSPSR